MHSAVKLPVGFRHGGGVDGCMGMHMWASDTEGGVDGRRLHVYAYVGTYAHMSHVHVHMWSGFPGQTDGHTHI